MNQPSVDAISAPHANSIPWVLEQVQCLQQQQLQQIQFTEQIRVQVNTWSPSRPPLLAGAGALNLGSHMSHQLSAAVALLSQKTGSQGLSLDTLKPAKLHHANILSTTSSVDPGPGPALGSLPRGPVGHRCSQTASQVL